MLVVSEYSLDLSKLGDFKESLVLSSKEFNNAIDYFKENKTFDFLCFILGNDVKFYTYMLRGSENLIKEFLLSYSKNRLPIQVAGSNYSSVSVYGEDEYCYYGTATLNHFPVLFVSRLAVESVGYIEDVPYGLSLWQKRISTLSGRHPDEILLLKHSFRYLSGKTVKADESTHKLLKDRIDEICRGQGLILK